jgi:anti-anti-sigma factor
MPSVRRTTVRKGHHTTERDERVVAPDLIAPADGRREVDASPERTTRQPPLRVRTIGRMAIVHIVDSEFLCEEAAVRAVREQLHHLIEDGGHTRLLVNFAGVRYLPCAVLGILAGLKKKVDPGRGCIQLCGMEPLLQDVLHITHLDGIFEVYTDEAEALGLMPH